MSYSLEFNTNERGIITLKECDILTDNFTLPYSYNPHNTKFYIIGHEFGAIVGLFADNEQEALDNMLNADYEQFLVNPEDYNSMSEEEKEELAYLGNASEPCDLTYCWITSYNFDLNKKSDFEIIHKMIIATERQLDNLDFYI